MAAISSEELHDAWQKVKTMTSLPELSEPKLPVSDHLRLSANTLVDFLTSALLSSSRYNYTGTLYFDVNKNRSFKSIVNTAKEILKEALPIQCLEAVFLAAYLTAGLSHLERFPISFKTKAGSSTHRHIILAVHYQQHKWGALGLSRCDKLMNKDVKFDSLSDLVLEYCREFQNVYHTVVKVNVGFPLSHDIHSSEKIEWRVLNLPVDTTNWTEVAKHFDMFAKEAAEIEIFKKAKGELPAWFNTKFALSDPDAELGMRSPRRCSNSLDFPDDFDDLDEVPPPEPTPAEPPKKVVRPIVVSPDELVFKKPSSLAKKGTGGTGSPRVFPDEPAPVPVKPTTAPRQVVSFRCTPMTRVSEDSQDEAPNGEAYTQEMLFIFKDM
ncbi:hypothetical protein BBJ28_00008820 [Nothophytophthora sp. Chile5]|nr:hypothetical protein BBJ28_00008820 [Nothophytophthora sp. Chile5]